MTEMACPGARGQQDAWLVGILSAGPVVRLDGNTLTLGFTNVGARDSFVGGGEPATRTARRAAATAAGKPAAKPAKRASAAKAPARRPTTTT